MSKLMGTFKLDIEAISEAVGLLKTSFLSVQAPFRAFKDLETMERCGKTKGKRRKMDEKWRKNEGNWWER